MRLQASERVAEQHKGGAHAAVGELERAELARPAGALAVGREERLRDGRQRQRGGGLFDELQQRRGR